MERYSNAINGRAIVSDRPLEDSQIMKFAPSVFSQGGDKETSDIYTFIPTNHLVNLLRNEGFYPFFATQSKSLVPGKESYVKHMLRFRPGKNFYNKEEVGEIILINSHDGKSSYRMFAGIFRFICQNGLMIGDMMEDYKITHKGNIQDEVLNAAYSITDNFEESRSSIDTMKSIELLPEEKQIFAESAMMLKYDKEEKPIKPESLLSIRRFEDKKDNLWTSFNTIQENLTKGGLRAKTKTGKRTKTRAVKAIDSNVKLNRALWNLTERMSELKNGKTKEPQNELIAL